MNRSIEVLWRGYQAGLGACLTLCLWMLGAPVHADPAAADQARATIHSGTERLLDVLLNDPGALRSDPMLAQRRVDEILGPHIDFVTIGRLLSGRHWRTSSPEQRQALVDEFRALLLRSYATALVEYVVDRGLDHRDFEYLSATATRDGRRALVRTRILRRQAPPVAVHYSMRRVDQAWKVYDVSVDGVSLVSVFRASLAETLARGGIDALIDRLRHSNLRRSTVRSQ